MKCANLRKNDVLLSPSFQYQADPISIRISNVKVWVLDIKVVCEKTPFLYQCPTDLVPNRCKTKNCVTTHGGVGGSLAICIKSNFCVQNLQLINNIYVAPRFPDKPLRRTSNRSTINELRPPVAPHSVSTIKASSRSLNLPFNKTSLCVLIDIN